MADAALRKTRSEANGDLSSMPIHMADMAVYLASDESAITTGQVISVDSGATIR